MHTLVFCFCSEKLSQTVVLSVCAETATTTHGRQLVKTQILAGTGSLVQLKNESGTRLVASIYGPGLATQKPVASVSIS